ncbi:hypothetical protein ACFY3J_38700 [Streptomyces sp. NPDC001231]
MNRDSPPVAVHVGGCHMAGKRWKACPGTSPCGHWAKASRLRALPA